MTQYEYVVYHFYVEDDYELYNDFIGSYDTIKEAEETRLQFLKDNPFVNPQNVQVIQLVF